MLPLGLFRRLEGPPDLEEATAAPAAGPSPRSTGSAAPARPHLSAPGAPRPSHSPPAPARAREDTPAPDPDPEVSRSAGPEVSGRVEF